MKTKLKYEYSHMSSRYRCAFTLPVQVKFRRGYLAVRERNYFQLVLYITFSFLFPAFVETRRFI